MKGRADIKEEDGKKSVTGVVCTLDAYLRNTMALIDAGVPVDRIVLCEIDPTVCLYQQLAIRGTIAQGVNVIYTDVHKFLSTQSENLAALYLDYCGDIPGNLDALLSKCVQLKVLAITRAYRNVNVKHHLPSLPSSTLDATFHHTRVHCNMWVATTPLILQKSNHS